MLCVGLVLKIFLALLPLLLAFMGRLQGLHSQSLVDFSVINKYYIFQARSPSHPLSCNLCPCPPRQKASQSAALLSPAILSLAKRAAAAAIVSSCVALAAFLHGLCRPSHL